MLRSQKIAGRGGDVWDTAEWPWKGKKVAQNTARWCLQGVSAGGVIPEIAARG